jgi:hypothetical protein
MLTFLTPAGAIVGLAVLLPLVALAVGARRVHGVRTALGLRRPRTGTDVARLAALVVAFALLALAGTQPALSHETSQRVRRDAQALFVVDTSRSMAASSGAAGATRLARATAAAAKLRGSIPEVESGIATLTDRVLPNLFPVADIPSFDATLQRSIGIERPPPRSAAVRATTYSALSEIPAAGFFDRAATRRVVVLLTDGESGPFDPGAVATALRPTKLVVVRFWRASESIVGDSAYRPDPASSAALGALAAAAGGRVFAEGDLGSAGAAIRTSIGNGPTVRVAARTRRQTALAPFAVIAALVPLALLPRTPGVGLELR